MQNRGASEPVESEEGCRAKGDGRQQQHQLHFALLIMRLRNGALLARVHLLGCSLTWHWDVGLENRRSEQQSPCKMWRYSARRPRKGSRACPAACPPATGRCLLASLVPADSP